MNTLRAPSSALRTRIAVLLAAFALFFGGSLLELTIGPRFLFFYGDRYTTAGWWAFMLLVPVIGAGMLNEHIRTQLRLRYPTWWIRWLLMYPLTVALLATMVVIAPLGWIAAFTWALGADTVPTLGRLVSVEDYRPSSKGCDQRGKLVVRERVASVCLEGISALPAKSNLSVLVAGRQSSFGLLIVGITPQ